jgi:MFS transporter, NNP family, nitrate/nitrite transporter
MSDGTTQVLIEGYSIPDPVSYAFLGPLIGAAARVVFSPLTDRFGGAVWTMVSAVGLLGAVLYTSTKLNPDVGAGAAAIESEFDGFLIGMLVIFLFAGIGNASTFKQMPMIFERRQAGGVLGWTAAIAAFGPFAFGVGLTLFEPRTFYLIGVAYAAMCIVIIWFRYLRPGAPKPS